MPATIDKSADLLLRPGVKELNYRENEGLHVWLLWDAPMSRTEIVLHDERSGQDEAFTVDPAYAADAFLHPFCYLANRSLV